MKISFYGAVLFFSWSIGGVQLYPKPFYQTIVDAVIAGNVTEVRRLASNDQLLGVMDIKGATILHYSIMHQKLDVSLFLIAAGLDMHAADRYGVTPLHLLALWADFSFFSAVVKEVKELRWEVRDVNGYTPLHYAVMRGAYDIVLLMLRHGVNIDSEDNWGVTPLHLAALKGHDALLSLLIGRGANPRKADKREMTALHKAVLTGAFTAVQILGRLAGTVAVKDRDFNTPLHFAVIRGNEEIVSWLLAVYEANTNAVNRAGKTPLHIAVLLNRKSIISLLMAYSADPFIRDQMNRSPLDYARLMNNQDLIDLLQKR